MTVKTVGQWVTEQSGALDQLDINDANDREIVREHFGIETEKSRGFYTGWVCYVRDGYFDESKVKLANAYEGKTIEEAEIAAITAIYEASQ